MLETKNLQVSYGDTVIIDELNLTLPKGKITALIGPNGCGKSTLLKALARINKPNHGDVWLNGTPLHQYQDKQLAREMSLLPQVLVTPEGITVRRLVEYGRSPYLSHWGKLGHADHAMVDKAMTETGISELAQHSVDALSGGQRQRAWIAMVLAQDTNIVMLDEPTTYLDLSHQTELMKIMRAMNEQGKTVIVVLHDLNQACRYCDHLVVLKQGQLVTQGAPEQVFTEALLEEVFSLKAKVITDPIANTPMCIAY
ncbi:Fe(3+) dicitrate ABC transporter ATP-binding protein FecE [Vibrio zhugei]|uniref:Fe(3+) dicitrate ABC transporter ATP-binding protein FecE n=1 Tax=Vibrio zhugei TaxID=2479546 RepID=A0ABV7CEC5_9VIBR|nr:Fe(3+) dicitrate ABC transporter ATP-binding protein FecE [Vibrio zhugei]